MSLKCQSWPGSEMIHLSNNNPEYQVFVKIPQTLHTRQSEYQLHYLIEIPVRILPTELPEHATNVS
jgi:hypothetical protein